MNVVMPLLASLVSLIFAIAVFDQYLARRRPYQLVWSLGLLMYSVATGCEYWVEAFGLSALPYRLWYLFGAVFVAAYLGAGTIYLLASRRAAHIVMVILSLASVFAAYKVFASPLDLSLLSPGETLSGEAFPSGLAGPRLLTPFFNIFGTLALVGGAFYSAWVFWRRRIMPHRVVSNVLIAVGALFPVTAGSFARFGRPEFLYLFELLGIIIIFIGFLRSREVFGLYRLPLIRGFRRLEG
jgi:hypothetical protein